MVQESVQLARMLDAYRLAKDYSWPQLASAMKKQHCWIPSRTLNYLMKRPPDHPRDRTLFKMRKFLSWARREDREAMFRARAIYREQLQHDAEMQKQQAEAVVS